MEISAYKGYITSELKHHRCREDRDGLGVHLRFWLCSGGVEGPKNVAAGQHKIICSGSRYCRYREEVVWYMLLSKSPSNRSFTLFLPRMSSVYITSSTDLQMSLSALHNFYFFAKWQSGSGFNSLGGHRKSLTRGLFAVRHYT